MGRTLRGGGDKALQCSGTGGGGNETGVAHQLCKGSSPWRMPPDMLRQLVDIMLPPPKGQRGVQDPRLPGSFTGWQPVLDAKAKYLRGRA